MQHLWAELSERLSDVVDSSIKYGGGAVEQRRVLDRITQWVANLEALEADLAAMGEQRSPERAVFTRLIAESKPELNRLLRETISSVNT